MLETAIALLSAHLLADFVFQTRRMVENKDRPEVLLLHVAIVVVLAAVLTGTLELLALAVLAATHLALDWLKVLAGKRAREVVKAGKKPEINALTTFIADQAGHLVVIYVLAGWFPQMFAQGAWSTDGAGFYAFLPGFDSRLFLGGLIVLAGLAATVQTGRFLVGHVVELLKYRPEATENSLPGAGTIIGVLERGFIFVLVLAGEPAAVGFLVAAKSVLRFDSAKDSQKRGVADYIIIGTLASFGWAVVVSFLTKAALGLV